MGGIRKRNPTFGKISTLKIQALSTNEIYKFFSGICYNRFIVSPVYSPESPDGRQTKADCSGKKAI